MFRLLALLALPATATEEEAIAKLQPLLGGGDTRKAACKTVGLAETATDAELDAATARHAAHAKLGAAACKTLGWDVGIPTDAEAKLTAELKHSGWVSFADHAAALRQGEVRVQQLSDDQLLADCRARGVLTPAMDSWALAAIRRDRPGFEQWAKTAPCSVPVNPARLPSASATSAGGLTDTDQAVCRQLGVEPKKFLEARS